MSVMSAVVQVHDDVMAALDDAGRKVLAAEGRKRDVWFVTGEDGQSLLKSVAAIRSKIVRELAAARTEAPPTLDEVRRMVLAFHDLGRFRVVCTHASDVQAAIRELLGEPPRNRLLGKYPIAGEVKDYVHDLRLRKPKSGHRAWQFAAAVESNDGPVFVEVQLMTLLQNAWDRRNHPVYEWTREGKDLPDRWIISDVALAETLYLVDDQAARNWAEFVAICNGGAR
ncbi:MAG: hypothetical protein HY905_10755 [Deltaproteobacteria bacterium]|nr:hypothetical protein [Deltaproteobacteria bacterium]